MNLFVNSLLVSALTAFCAVTCGFAGALAMAALPDRWRRRTVWVGLVALTLPPFLVTNCWLRFLGHAGIWRHWVPFDIYSLGGSVWILTLLTWPIAFLLVHACWQQLEPAQFECDPALTGWALIRWLLMPAAKPGLKQAGFLTFVLALNNFAVPAILQVKVFPAELWVRFNTNLDYAAAVKLSVPLVVVPLVLLWWWRGQTTVWPRREGRAGPRFFRRQLGPGWLTLATVIAVPVAVLSVMLPVYQLISAARTWTEFPGALAAGQEALENSFLFAAGSASIVMLLALGIWRWRAGFLLWLPFLVPGVVLGIGLVYLGDYPFLTRFYESFGIVWFALALRYLAVGWQGTGQAMRRLDPDLTDLARLSGASGWQTLKEVRWPQIGGQLSAVWYIVYLLSLWDVGTLVMIIPPGDQTLALRIFNLLHYGHNAQVNALCLLLLGLALLPFILWETVRFVRARWQGLSGILLGIFTGGLLSGCGPGLSARGLPGCSTFAGLGAFAVPCGSDYAAVRRPGRPPAAWEPLTGSGEPFFLVER